jgi:hypothetical protein
MLRRIGMVMTLLALIAVVGCGGGGAPAGSAPGGTVGTLQVVPMSVATFKAVDLSAPDTSPYAYVAYYGSKIVRLGYTPWPGTTAPARTVIGPAATDAGGKNPPLGASRPLAVVGYSSKGLNTAITADITTTPATAVLDKILHTGSDVLVAQLTAAGVSAIYQDNGPGVAATKVALTAQGGVYPGAVLIIISVTTGRISGIVPLTDALLASVDAGKVWAEARDGQVILHAHATAVLVPQPGGGVANLVPAGGVSTITLDVGTAQPVAAR